MTSARRLNETDVYRKLRQIDGRHPIQDRVPGGSVLYRVRRRKNGRVVYFNFALAKEMGLVPADHPHKVTRELRTAILDTFAIQIINEHDIIAGAKFPADEVKEHPYMATRYLQLQHPDKRGLQSGDGRSIWNGYVDHRGKTWDISSCGTGATCLSPASVLQGKFFATGDPQVSYGCGYSEVAEGMSDALFSEIFHRNGVRTERTLAVLEFPGGFSINVRAAENLLRPSHMFNHLKQENHERLKAVVDLFIERQVRNKDFPISNHLAKDRYDALLKFVVERFAEITARFENDYIFCWLDWDGDNVLADGGIIDYGSIRQFGLFHFTYRFDDVERWSTTITEQKQKARYTVQTFIQLVDFLKTGKRKPLDHFKDHKSLNAFDQHFSKMHKTFFLRRIGFTSKQINALLSGYMNHVDVFQRTFAAFERTTSSKGEIRIEDGVTKNAIFCMRDVLRELPHHFLRAEELMGSEEFVEILRSNYATDEDLKLSDHRRRMIRTYQHQFLDLVDCLVTKYSSRRQILTGLVGRSDVINRQERITGDAIVHVTDKLIKSKEKLSQEQLQKLMEGFIVDQVLDPDNREIPLSRPPKVPQNTKKIMTNIMKIVRAYREGL